jgi:cysteine desulfurase
MKTIYFYHAATTPLREEVLEAMMPFLTGKYGNASSTHSKGREARMAVENSRKTIADILGVAPSTIMFTSGGTESNNTAISAAVHSFKCSQLISSGMEHHAVILPFEHTSNLDSINSSLVNITPDGKINMEDLADQLFHFNRVGRKCFVSLMSANNETGALLDTQEVGSLCKNTMQYFIRTACKQWDTTHSNRLNIISSCFRLRDISLADRKVQAYCT